MELYQDNSAENKEVYKKLTQNTNEQKGKKIGTHIHSENSSHLFQYSPLRIS